MHKPIYDTVIIGAGVAGLGAAVYTGRFQMKTAMVGKTVGGTIILTDDIANYPGFGQITGMDLAAKLETHVNDYDVEIVEKVVSKITRCPEGCFKVFTGKEYLHPRTIIFATGTEWRKLNVPGEREFANRGVHYCALCDGALYKDKVIGVAGGSDSAAKEALLLAEYGKRVYIFYRKEKIRPEPINLERITNHQKIEIVNNTNIKEINGDRFVSSITLDKPYKGSTEFKLDALFVEIGHIPLSALAEEIGVEINQKGEVKIDRDSNTNIAGFFAAGDVVDTPFKQAITGVAQGATAAYSAYHYVNEHEHILCRSDDE